MIFCGVFLIGCTSLLKPEEIVVTQEVFVEKIPLGLEMPTPVVWKDFKFLVVTPDNYEKVIERLKSEGKRVALFAVDNKDYENLSLVVSDMKRYIGEQKIIIVEYKKYYEPIIVDRENTNG